MRRQRDIRLPVAIFMAIALALFLPCLGDAGSLEPTLDAVDSSGNPVPTMKTLDEVLPAWSQKLRADDGPNGDKCNSSRFKCVMDGSAVLDKETGLVWEREPWNYEGDWLVAKIMCAGSFTGWRYGWRLPTLSELLTLQEYCPGSTYYHLPCGHPFINLKTGDGLYWTATTWFNDSNLVPVFSPAAGFGELRGKTFDYHMYNWCVRGGVGINVNE